MSSAAELWIDGEGDAPEPRAWFLTAAQIEALPKPGYRIPDILVLGALVVLYGPPGSFKSFLALSWALSIATGFDWLGRPTEPGPVLYVAAEGSAGMGARVRAWKQYHHFAGEIDAYFLTAPAGLSNASQAAELLIAITNEMPALPALIVIDTLSRDLAGKDENSQADMSAYIANVDRLRTATGATIVIIHHTNATAERERGSTVLRGAADTMIQIKNEDGIVVSCEKQKDDHPFPKIQLEVQPVGESAVLTAKSAWQLPTSRLTEKETVALESLTASAPAGGLAASTWLKVSAMTERSFYRAIKALQGKGFVKPDREGRGALYTATADGIAALTDNCQLTANSLPDSDRHSLPAAAGVLGTRGPVSNGSETDEQYERWEAERAVSTTDQRRVQ